MNDGKNRRPGEIVEGGIDAAADEQRPFADRGHAGDDPPRRQGDAPAAAHPGSVVFDPGDHVAHYAILRELGRGGMGVVYLARDTKLDRQVAIKFLLDSNPDFVRRFMVEARALARCTHENIVVIHAAGEHQGNPYMVLEYHKGQTLREWLSERATPLSPEQAVTLLLPVTRALECAHALGIVHRDLKPENIMITSAGAVKVLDFGIAKILADAQQISGSGPTVPAGLAAETQAGRIVGTLPYMSPEQWGADDIDHRSDLWAVGIMLFEMVVGRHPLAPLSHSKLRIVAALHVPMPSARAAAPSLGALAEVIDLCLIKHKRERIASAAELRSRLERLRFDDGARVEPASETTVGPRGTSHSPGRAADGLEFANVTLERRQTSWKLVPGRPGRSVFDGGALLRLQLDRDATAADLPFDVTLLNLAGRPVTLSHIGLEVVEFHASFERLLEDAPLGLTPRGLPEARKVEKQDAYVIEGNAISRMLRPHMVKAVRHRGVRGQSTTERTVHVADVDTGSTAEEAAIVAVGETVWSELDDPVYLEAAAPYRFGMIVKNFRGTLPDNLILRLAARTQLGEYYSSAIEACMSSPQAVE